MKIIVRVNSRSSIAGMYGVLSFSVACLISLLALSRWYATSRIHIDRNATVNRK